MTSDADEYECEYEDDASSPRHEPAHELLTDVAVEQDAPHLADSGIIEHEEELDKAMPVDGQADTEQDGREPDDTEEELEDDRDIKLEDEPVEDEIVDEEVVIAEHVGAQRKGAKSPSRKLRSMPTKSVQVQQQQQQLLRKLKSYQKRNAELHHQLQLLYKNDAIAQLENRAKEKQLHIEQVMQENRLLLYQQRLLAKQIEELQGSKEDLPRKHSAIVEELRVYKDRVRRYKEQLKVSEEKASRAHQQAVDLAAKNKELAERLRQREGHSSSNPSSARNPLSPCTTTASLHSFGVATPRDGDAIIASQEDEITKLQHRVALLKKVQHSDRIKYERLVKSSEEQVEQTRQHMDALLLQMTAKEKAMRSQFLAIKTLKRSLHEITMAQQSNVYMQQFLVGRDGRIAAASHHHSSQVGLHQLHPHHQHNHQSSHAKAPMPRKATSKRIQDTLWKLGFLPSSHSSPPRHSALVEIDQRSLNDEERRSSGEPTFCRQDEEIKTPTWPRPPEAARNILASGSSRPHLFGLGASGRSNYHVVTMPSATDSAQNSPAGIVPFRDSRPTSVEPNVRLEVGPTTEIDSREDDAGNDDDRLILDPGSSSQERGNHSRSQHVRSDASASGDELGLDSEPLVLRVVD